MSSCPTSSLESAIMRRVWANVLTVETVSVRSFLRPRISRKPFFGSYLTLDRLRSGKRRRGFWCLRMVRRTSSAVFSIFRTVAWAMVFVSPSGDGAQNDGTQGHAHGVVAELAGQLLGHRVDDGLRVPAALAQIGADRVSLDQTRGQVARRRTAPLHRH